MTRFLKESYTAKLSELSPQERVSLEPVLKSEIQEMRLSL